MSLRNYLAFIIFANDYENNCGISSFLGLKSLFFTLFLFERIAVYSSTMRKLGWGRNRTCALRWDARHVLVS